jgi:hypothetical protein
MVNYGTAFICGALSENPVELGKAKFAACKSCASLTMYSAILCQRTSQLCLLIKLSVVLEIMWSKDENSQ